MSFSRLVNLLVVLTLCLSPLSAGDRAQARWIEPTMTKYAPGNISVQDGAVTPDELAIPRFLETRNTTLVSLASDGRQGNEPSQFPSVSADGRFVAFFSLSDNLVGDKVAYRGQIFVRDRQNGETTIVSVASDGTVGNNISLSSMISANGRFVTFSSDANNLVVGDTNNSSDIFVYDRQSGTTERVSVASDGTQANLYSQDPTISADGRFVAFSSNASNLVGEDTNNSADIFVHDRQSGETRRVSLASDGTQGNGHSYCPSVSADGRFVAFLSYTSNLVGEDTNNMRDIFVHDRQTGETWRVSLASDGTQANDSSGDPSISADGRFVAFNSRATNLVDGDTNEKQDIFVHDLQGGGTWRVSLRSDGTQANNESFEAAISADGNFVTFSSEASNLVIADTNGVQDVFVHDRRNGETLRASITSNGTQGNYWSYTPAISADGRFIAFASLANNLVEGDTNEQWDVFVYDQGTGGRTAEAWFSAAPTEGKMPLSVAFTNLTTCGDVACKAAATSLWDFGDETTSTTPDPIHIYDRPGVYTVTLTAISPGGTDIQIFPGYIIASGMVGDLSLVSLTVDGTPGNGHSANASVSADGRYVAFQSIANNLVSGDTNDVDDIFVRDRQSGKTERVSVASDGTQGNGGAYYPSISADGRLVAFRSEASNLVSGDTNGAMDVFVHNRQSGETRRVSVASDGTQANSGSYYPVISADGGFVAYASWASNLVNGDTNNVTDVFIHNLKTGETRRVSVASDGSQGNSTSGSLDISIDGRFVAFGSEASNLVSGDTNNAPDIFVHECQSGKTQRVSLASDGTQANDYSHYPTISADGRFVFFGSWASNLVSGDTNDLMDIFVHDRQSGETQRVSVTSDGSQANERSFQPAVSSDGRFVAFGSNASNLVKGDTGDPDIFIHDRQDGKTRLLSFSATTGIYSLKHLDISSDGRFVVFDSKTSNLISEDTNGLADVFINEWATQEATSIVLADFSAAPLSGVNPLTVTFYNQTTCRDVACNVSTNLWFFGDGETSTLSSPIHTYTASGLKDVMLLVSGPGGTDTLTRPGYIVVRGPLSYYLPLVRR